MATADTTGRQRPRPASQRPRHAHRLDPNPDHWIERQRERRPEGWCARLRADEDTLENASACVTSLEWW